MDGYSKKEKKGNGKIKLKKRVNGCRRKRGEILLPSTIKVRPLDDFLSAVGPFLITTRRQSRPVRLLFSPTAPQVLPAHLHLRQHCSISRHHHPPTPSILTPPYFPTSSAIPQHPTRAVNQAQTQRFILRYCRTQCLPRRAT
jgi:hypothetical protein